MKLVAAVERISIWKNMNMKIQISYEDSATLAQTSLQEQRLLTHHSQDIRRRHLHHQASFQAAAHYKTGIW